MKKIIGLILILFILVGCAQSNVEEEYFIEGDNINENDLRLLDQDYTKMTFNTKRLKQEKVESFEIAIKTYKKGKEIGSLSLPIGFENNQPISIIYSTANCINIESKSYCQQEIATSGGMSVKYGNYDLESDFTSELSIYIIEDEVIQFGKEYILELSYRVDEENYDSFINVHDFEKNKNKIDYAVVVSVIFYDNDITKAKIF